MRVFVPCAKCFDPGSPPLTFHAAELSDAGVVYLSCPKGHDVAVAYDERRYQVLLRSGVAALLDGYASEAAAVASSALERAYEFAIRVLCRHRNVDGNLFEKTWKAVSAQSERQLGAFMFLYALAFGDAWTVPPQMVEFRNRVIHRGYIPLEKEAIEYCESLYGLVRKLEVALEGLSAAAVAAECQREIQAQQALLSDRGIEYLTLQARVAIVLPGTGDTDTARLPENFEEYCSAVAYWKQGPGGSPRDQSDAQAGS